jgi:serine/threonine protein kinase
MSLDLDAKQIKGYTFRDIIGEGGFAFVYRAYQSVIEREVAVKVIIPILADHPQFIQHFETEAQLVARLEHPFIVPLYDYWREPGSAYLVMRLLKGGNLRRVLSQGLMSPANVIRFTGQIASALARAHYSGVVHRDLKPENILLDENDNAYLSDFGLAWILNQAADSSDNDFEGFGSPAYAAPEQFTGGVITASADQYSLAVILYELLTGYHPIPDIENSSFTQIITKKNIASLPPLSSMRTDLPFQMDKILQKATA